MFRREHGRPGAGAKHPGAHEHTAEFEAALDQQDVEAALQMFTDDARVTRPDGQVFEGKEGIRSWLENAAALYAVDVEIGSEKMLVYPDGKKALDRGIYFVDRTPTEGSERERESGWYRLFWQRQPDNTWQVSRLNWLKAPAPGEEEPVS